MSPEVVCSGINFVIISVNRYQLMLDCWSERPEYRPTFRLCLEVIQMLQRSYAELHKNIPWSERNANIGTLSAVFAAILKHSI